MNIRINSDVFNICRRIKDIDIGYYIVLNTDRGCFEIRNSNQYGTSYCLTLPYNTLDARTICYVHQTKNTNIEKILDSIDSENSRLKKCELEIVQKLAVESIVNVLKKEKR